MHVMSRRELLSYANDPYVGLRRMREALEETLDWAEETRAAGRYFGDWRLNLALVNAEIARRASAD